MGKREFERKEEKMKERNCWTEREECNSRREEDVNLRD